MTEEAEGGLPSPESANGTSTAETAPQSIPDLHGDDPAGGSDVTDEDRHRYGVLLDRAAERGLLTPYEYELRLGDLASATTIDSMQKIVTELPAFTAPTVVPARGSQRRRGPSSMGSGSLGAASASPRKASPWLLLAVLVVVVVASLAFLAVYVHHVVQTHPDGMAGPGTVVRQLSALRL